MRARPVQAIRTFADSPVRPHHDVMCDITMTHGMVYDRVQRMKVADTPSIAGSRWYKGHDGLWHIAPPDALALGRYGNENCPVVVSYYHNSHLPPEDCTVSLSGTGKYVLWMEGSGSITIAAGTATGTGWGTATDGSPVVIDITAGGTVVCTVSGSPTLAQINNGTSTNRYVPNEGTSTSSSVADTGKAVIPFDKLKDGTAELLESTDDCTVAVRWRQLFIDAPAAWSYLLRFDGGSGVYFGDDTGEIIWGMDTTYRNNSSAITPWIAGQDCVTVYRRGASPKIGTARGGVWGAWTPASNAAFSCAEIAVGKLGTKPFALRSFSVINRGLSTATIERMFA